MSLPSEHLNEHLSEDDIVLGLQAEGKPQLFEAIGRHMQARHGVDAGAVARALQRREMAGTTALGRGVAIPHAMVPELDRIHAAYVRLAAPLPFDAEDGEPASDLIVLLVPAPGRQQHLDLLAQVAERCVDPRFRQALHASGDAAEVKALFERWRAGWPQDGQ